MKAKYEMEQGHCPMCNSFELDYDVNEVIDNTLRYPYTCQDCGFIGAEDYTLTFDVHIAYANGMELLENPKD